jgi:nucleotide-binding universal stress UspA family protein
MTTARPMIAVGFDDTREAYAAVHWAANEATLRGARLRIVSAWDPTPVTPWTVGLLAEWRTRARHEAEQAASRVRDDVSDGLAIHAVAPEGDPGSVLVDESTRCDLLVIGSTGHVGFGGFLAGSVSRHCLHHAHSPLVVLGPKAHQDQTARLVLSSTLDQQHETFEWVAERLRLAPVPVHVVSSFDATMGLAELAETVATEEIQAAVHAEHDLWVSELRAYLDSCEIAAATISGSVLQGPSQHILESQTRPGDLIVVPSGCEHAVPLARGVCPIVVIPPHRRARATADRGRAEAVLTSPLAAPAVG